MQFICKNISCAISISKATFPIAMNCPVCQSPLVENNNSIDLSPEDLELINSLPYVIAYPLKRTLLENHSWTKINLLKDSFLNYLKYLGLLSASEFFNSEIKDKGMVALFHKNLMETAFGKWNHYIRECLAFLKQQNHTFFYPELPAYYELVETGSKSKKYKGEIEYQDANGDTQIIVQTSITSIGMLINFRNRYLGHGQTLDEVKSTELWNEYFPIFRHLLEQLSFTKDYPMLKHEHGETYLLHSSEIKTVESSNSTSSNIWIENKNGKTFDILPFFIVPGEVSLAKEDKEQLLTYESYTGKTIKFFSPEGTEKQTSGKILEKLNLLLRDKQKETPFTPEAFTKDEFLKRIAEENKLLLDTLVAEKKIIPAVYQHREEMEIKLREWIGARANIFFIAAEAGSGKTNLLAEIQKQYTERQLPSLLIRAGRMEKQTLKQQITYLLNIDFEKGLENYTSIAGAQAEPTFILIDGLNEANNAEEIWQEIIELSKLFEPGSLKFVVTNRANTKADLERYLISDSENDLLYGENKDNEKGLGAYTFWLTVLDMKEMKGAWESYVAKDKSRFKPLFTFDEIAVFDRALYNQINNPLILRLFLEIYNGKQLPKKGNKHLHVWEDWFKTFNTEEQTFLKILADEIWLIGGNELLLDDVLKNEMLKPYLTSDIINAPYNRLKNNGWISRYVKDLNGYIGFTVEGALFYLLGTKLINQIPEINIDFIHTILKNGTKLQKAAIESFLCEHALNGNLGLVTNLIDAGNDDIDLSINPLLLFLKTFGVKATIEKVLENPTENDWKALLKLKNRFGELQLKKLENDILSTIALFNNFDFKDSLILAFANFKILDYKSAREYFDKIDLNNSFFESYELSIILGDYYLHLGEYDQALIIYEKCMKISLNTNDSKKTNLANDYSSIAVVYRYKGDYDNSLLLFEKCLILKKEIYNRENLSIASTYANLGYVWSKKRDNKTALEFYNKSLLIKLKFLGEFHISIANLLNNIAVCYDKMGNIKEAISYIEKSLRIKNSFFNNEDVSLAISYNNIGDGYSQIGKFEDAMYNLEKGLIIRKKHFGDDHPLVAQSLYNIGENLFRNDKFDEAIEYYENALRINLLKLGDYHHETGRAYSKLGLTYNAKGEIHTAYEYYNKSGEIMNTIFGIESELTKDIINIIKVLAIKIGIENNLPDWIKNNINS
jgi:tetratricopeptide (TPR) repeat protein